MNAMQGFALLNMNYPDRKKQKRRSSKEETEFDDTKATFRYKDVVEHMNNIANKFKGYIVM